jgi:hypothetical protein
MSTTKSGTKQLIEKVKLLLLEWADDFKDYDVVEFYAHVRKSRKDVKIHPKQIDTGEKTS